MKFFFFAIILSISANAGPTVLSPILDHYYQLKDALVSGDAAAASSAAGEMLKAIGNTDVKSMTPADRTAFMALQDKLAFDARHISESKDINHQREHFGSLSANLIKLARQVRLSPTPIYEDYCPMKKAYWLSNDPAIRNPYFGSAMPTCGKISTTIQP
ncbi:MAG TPA: DUF3347 domain-containing protein [Puia sp.]|nr:DUF3347 domain-containing protein [Puia sp.]